MLAARVSRDLPAYKFSCLKMRLSARPQDVRGWNILLGRPYHSRSRYDKLSRVPGNAGLVAVFSRPESQGSGAMALGRSPSMCEYAAESWETGGPELPPLIRLRCCRNGACSTRAYRVSALLSALWTHRCPPVNMVVAVHIACEVENMGRASQPGRYGVCLRHRSPPSLHADQVF